jgi:hypothetical protein
MRVNVILAAFILLMAANCLMALKPRGTHEKMPGQWFEYIGPQGSKFVTLADARNRSNYQYGSSAPNTLGSGNLKAIFVQQSEIDDNGTPDDLIDDLPKTDVSSTDGYAVLGLAKDPVTGAWNDLTFNTATVEAE